MCSSRVKVVGFPCIQNRGSIVFGVDVDLRSNSSSTALGVTNPVVLNTLTSDAVIQIGDAVGMSGAVICAKGSVTIRDRVMIGSGAVVCDTDFHSLDHLVRGTSNDMAEAAQADVVIEEDVFVGARSMILKGVRVGARSVVGAGAVVVQDVPPDVVVAGNPAKVLKSLIGGTDEKGE